MVCLNTLNLSILVLKHQINVYSFWRNFFPSRFNRPGVAGAVLQTPLFLIHSFIYSSTGCVWKKKTSVHLHSQSIKAQKLKFWEMVDLLQPVMCIMLGKLGGWRVFYQRGLHCLFCKVCRIFYIPGLLDRTTLIIQCLIKIGSIGIYSLRFVIVVHRLFEKLYVKLRVFFSSKQTVFNKI